MSFRNLSKSIVFLVLIGLLPGQHIVVYADSQYSEPNQLRVSEPVEKVIADLREFIPTYKHDQKLPGASVALIRDGDLVWSQGFGVANSLTRIPVTANTLFEVASNSKVVTAYIALRLVDEGVLSLDQPLNSYLVEPWLPPSEYRDEITLRQVLSHSSGLGHGPPMKDIHFIPGSGYSYSANGYEYLQAVLEEVTGKPLEKLAQEMVFTPLNMNSSSFLDQPQNLDNTANGHLPAAIPAMVFLIPFLITFIILGAVGIIFLRVRTGRWRPNGRNLLTICIAAAVLTCLAVIILFAEMGGLDYALLIVISGLVLLSALLLLTFLGLKLLNKYLPNRAVLKNSILFVWVILVIIGLSALTVSIKNVPVPKGMPVKVSSAGTLRTTASDLALFLIELSDPQLLEPETAQQLRQSQVRLHRGLSWGLGPGIQHSIDGDALWQWGQSIDFQSIMMIYPDLGSGVVVLTNGSSFLNSDVAIEISNRALGGELELIRRASHLDFNFKGPFLDEYE